MENIIKNFMIQNWIIVLYSLFIVSVAVIFWSKFKNDMKPVVKDMTEAVNLLKGLKGLKGKSHNVDDELPEWKPDAMTVMFDNIEYVKSKMSEITLLKASWREFYETLLMPGDDFDVAEGAAPKIRNTRLANEFFNLKHTVSGNVNLRMFNSIPNFLTGLGILGTFIGLAWGVNQASVGLAASDVKKAMEALKPLLAGASLAFITSIFGLLTSLIFQWAEKSKLHQLEGLINELVNLLDERLLYMSVDSFSSHSLREVKKQTRLLSTLREEQQKANNETIQKVVEQFTTSISSAAGHEMDLLANTLGNMTTKLNETITLIGSKHQDMEISTQQTISKMSDVFERSSEKFTEQVDESVQIFQSQQSSVTTQIDEIIEKTDAFNEKSILAMEELMNKTQIQGENSIESITKKTDESLSKLLESTENAISGMETSVLNTNNATEIVIRSMDESVSKNNESTQNSIIKMQTGVENGIVSAIGKLNDSTNHMIKSLTEETKLSVDSMLNNSSFAVGQVTDKLEDLVDKTVSKITETTNKQVESILQKTNEVVLKMKKSVDSINDGSLKNIIKATEKLHIANQEVSVNYSEISEISVKQQQMFQQMSELIDDFVKDASQVIKGIEPLKDASSSFYTASIKIENIAQTLTDASEVVGNSITLMDNKQSDLTKNITNYDANQIKAIESLKVEISEFKDISKEHMTSFDKASKNISDYLTSTLNKLRTVTTQLGNTNKDKS
jgi:Txe/YoeB family toxin of Txe-Axe toxin-antitoxin module